MRYLTSIVLILILTTFSCKNEPSQKLTYTEKIAQANGIDSWDKINELSFTFNVDRDTLHFERHWIWRPKTGEVTMIMNNDTVSYNREAVDEASLKADKAFINDTYWLLAPFKLVWDEGFTQDSIIRAEAPISKDSLNKLTILYDNKVGYTPGDAYDFYVDDEYMIQEWVYRQGNSQTDCMMTTWEDYKKQGGISFATMHSDETGKFKLYFTDLNVQRGN